MNSSVKRMFSIVISTFLASGAESLSADPGLKVTFAPVMTHQTKDLSMSCDELQSEIKDAEQKMRVLEKQIALRQRSNNTQTTQGGSHDATVSTAQSGSANNQPMDIGHLKVNYIERHHALMRIYFERCVLGSRQPAQHLSLLAACHVSRFDHRTSDSQGIEHALRSEPGLQRRGSGTVAANIWMHHTITTGSS